MVIMHLRKGRTQNDVLPTPLLDALPELSVLLPTTLVENEDTILLHSLRVRCGGGYQSLYRLGALIIVKLTSLAFLQNEERCALWRIIVIVVILAELVYDEAIARPLIVVPGEVH
jgi:hypothetical protein